MSKNIVTYVECKVPQKRFENEIKNRVCNMAAGSLGELPGVISHQKWIQPFLLEIRCWISFYSTSFSKKAVFSDKTEKNWFGGAFDNFLGRGDILHQKLT